MESLSYMRFPHPKTRKKHMFTRLVRSLYLGLLISPHVFAHDQQNQSAFSKLLTSYRASEWHNSTVPITRSYASHIHKLKIKSPEI